MPALLSPARLEDLQVEEAVRKALDTHAQVPGGRIAVSVDNCVVTLTGKVDWRFQQAAAVAATKAVRGVRDVVNTIGVVYG